MAKREDDTHADRGDEAPKAPVQENKPGLLDSPWTYLLIIPVVIAIWLIYANSRENSRIADLPPETATVSEHRLVDADADAFANAIAKVWAGEAVDRKLLPARLGEPAQSVYVAFRSDGKRLYQLWRHPKDVAGGGTVWDVLLQALEDGSAAGSRRRGSS
jgi:hypothetical protein